ncbi:hypothetical protein N7454_002965 [Penicillium verhagenii]|nr:hypothetical protein N7454_002965 [Penicillium verhagenii]
MKTSFAFGIAVLATQILGQPISSEVALNGGTLQGQPRSDSGILEFLGIPYAAPPVGDLRWKSPEAAPRFNGTISAKEFGASCYNAELGAPSLGSTSEDCLKVNVWTGAQDSTDKRPVMVWIYGGGFQFGSSSQANYNGTNLAREGVVLVSFNYRLGVLGFLGLSELDSEGPSSGNFGLQDQLAALRWVQENIAQFGGDPDNVTIFGESAGAHSVGLLLTSPFQKGCSIERFSKAEHTGTGMAFQQKLGAASVADLRVLSAEQVNNAALWNSSTDPAVTAFTPSIDNYVIIGVPASVFDNGQTQRVPILAGFNADEEYLFLSRALPHSTPGEFVQSMTDFFGPQANESLQVYPSGTALQTNQSANALDGDLVIREQIFEAVDRQALVSGQTCYAYYFTYTSAYSPSAAHTAEINFVFGNLIQNAIFGATAAPSEADSAMSRMVMSYWTNFAKTGNPNGADSSLPEWPNYTANGINFLELGNNVSAIANPDLARFQFIQSLRTNGALPEDWRTEFTNN